MKQIFLDHLDKTVEIISQTRKEVEELDEENPELDEQMLVKFMKMQAKLEHLQRSL